MDAGRSKEEQKEDAARVADTNVEGIGSQENRDLRKAAAETEAAWKGAGDKVGLQIWRIEKFKVVAWPAKRYGEFYSGDSYIVLNTKEDPESKAKSYDVHFWLGKDTSQDEMGTAAYKTVELDDLLGDEPVQYREVQGNESRMFTDMFKKITVLDGGVKSGFNIVEPESYAPRLLHIEGYHENLQVFQVKMNAKSLNNIDSFVLDAGLSVYVFNGPKANSWEKRKANDVMNALKDERNGKVTVDVTIDGLEDDQKEADEFWKLIGGKPDAITDDDPEEKETLSKREMCVVQLAVDANNKIKATKVCDGAIKGDVLKSDDAFIVDTGVSIYVWIGSKADKKEKKEAMIHASQYLMDLGVDPRNVPVCRVTEGKEPSHFRQILGMKKWDASMMKKGGFAGRKSTANVLRDMRPEK